MALNNDLAIWVLCLNCGLGLSLSSCNGLKSESETSLPATASPTASATPKPSSSAQGTTIPQTTSKTVPKTATISPLTFDKLKNTKYYILASGPVTLKDGKAVDQGKRVFTLAEPYTYGDLNKDGIKDAVAPLTITIGDRNFVYLVTVVNDQGKPRNNASQFLGEGVSVTELALKDDNLVVKMTGPGVTITRTYEVKKLKSAQDNPSTSQDNQSKPPASPTPPTTAPTKSP